ncbi:DUF808 domain-containing protein [Persephonella sp.]
MATGLLALLDDIAVIMDDLASATKVATQKTSAILADDLAVSAKKASGYASERELPVIWAIAKGSFINKLIILPFIFALSYFAPALIPPILILGGLYLSYEGTEKVIEYIFYRKKDEAPDKNMTEKEKIRSAILTDFILSIEILIIALYAVQDEPFHIQVASVSFIAVVATVGVYGLVALLVRMDDFGLKLYESYEGFLKRFGIFLVQALPYVIKGLSVIGTIAMLLVGGGILGHNVSLAHKVADAVVFPFGELIIGLTAGFLVFIFIKIFKSIKGLTG